MGSFNLTADLEEKTVAMATEYDTEGGNKQLGLSLHVDRTETCDVFLHAPYWIINKTGLPLQIRVSALLFHIWWQWYVTVVIAHYLDFSLCLSDAKSSDHCYILETVKIALWGAS